MKIEVLGVVGDQVLIQFKDDNDQMNMASWLNPPEAERVIFELQNFLHEQNNHLNEEKNQQGEL